MKGALIGLAIGGASGALFGVATAKGKSDAVVVIAALGVLVGPALGVQQYADNRGGTGRGWGTAVGALGGITVGATSMYGMLKEKETSANIMTGVAIMVACTIAGPVIGYRSTRTGTTAMDSTRIITLGTMAF